MFQKKFLALLSKEAVTTFVAAFAATMLADPGFSTAAAAAGLVAGARAVLGLLVINVGEKGTPRV